MTDLTRVIVAVAAIGLALGVALAAGAGAVAADGDGAIAGNQTHGENETPTAQPNGTWTFEEPGDAVETSPTVGDDRVYVGSLDGHVYAVDAENGTEDWRVATARGFVVGAPALDDGTLYVGALDPSVQAGSLHALDAETGEERWNVTDVQAVVGSPVVADGTVYVTATNASEHTGTVHALNASTGEERWNHSLHYEVRAPPVVADGRVYVAGGDQQLLVGHDENDTGTVRALDAANGSLDWSLELAEEAIQSAPTLADGSLFVGTNDGTLYALDADSGNETWRATTDLAIRARPSVADGSVVVGDWGPVEDEGAAGVYAFDATTGDRQWATNDTAAIYARPVVHDGTVFVGDESGVGEDSDGNVHAFDASTGDREWRYERPANWIRSAPTASNDRLYFGTQGGTVHAIDPDALPPNAALAFAENASVAHLEVAPDRETVRLTANRTVDPRSDVGNLTLEWSTGANVSGTVNASHPDAGPLGAVYEVADGDAGSTVDVTLTATNEAGLMDSATVSIAVQREESDDSDDENDGGGGFSLGSGGSDDPDPSPASFDVALDVPDEEVAAGQRATIGVTLENTGETAGSVDYEVVVDGDVVGTVSAELEGGEQTTRQVSATADGDDDLPVRVRDGSVIEASASLPVAAANEDDGDDDFVADDLEQPRDDDTVPGFGVGVALAALLAIAAARARRSPPR